MPVTITRDGAVATVTMSRPEALNAFNTEQLQALLDAVNEVAGDASVRCAILTGEGSKAFAAGADIKEMADKSPSEALAFGQLGHAIGAAINAAPQPWIAAVNGFALGGGCEMALACDIRLASENAVLGQPEVGLGILPGWGATQRLTRLVGPGIASELIFTGRRVKADEALRLGLVNAVYASADLLPKALEMAQTNAANGPLAVTASKRMISLAFDTSLAHGLAREADTFALLFDSADQKAGMSAFVEKRKPEFTGK
jgi:enoyl-CoA hydratase